MKKSIVLFCFCYLWGVFIPLLCVINTWPEQAVTQEEASPTQSTISSTILEPEPDVPMLVTATGETTWLSMEEYLCGVLAGEMPASYPYEALCAQAVAARTYTIYHLGTKPHNGGASLCDDSSCCMAYLSKEQATEKWGENWVNKYYPNIAKAVRETHGEILTYENKPINAVFHDSSKGETKSSLAVWGTDLPYLQSVSTQGDEDNGHGVGLSQVGAKEMALEGYTYKEIAEWYYTGATVTKAYS